ncbi:hypothetical protein XM72_c21031 [Vibrio vulnificus]|nr:hypothetical protein XM72_c21031 [Vibrio vulnificus]
MNTIVCDEGYNSDPFRHFVQLEGETIVIAKRNYGQDIDKESMDWCLYEHRHLVEMRLLKSSIIDQYQSGMTS